MARRRERWTWLSRLLSIPGLVKGAVAAFAAIIAITTKAWVATLQLPLAYQLALATAVGLLVIFALGVAAKAWLPHPRKEIRIRLTPVAVGRMLGVVVHNDDSATVSHLYAEVCALQFAANRLPLPWTVGWVGNTSREQRIGPLDNHSTVIFAISYSGQVTEDGDDLFSVEVDPLQLNGDGFSPVDSSFLVTSAQTMVATLRVWDIYDRGEASIRLEVGWEPGDAHPVFKVKQR